jgi:hypothetical protein
LRSDLNAWLMKKQAFLYSWSTNDEKITGDKELKG